MIWLLPNSDLFGLAWREAVPFNWSDATSTAVSCLSDISEQEALLISVSLHIYELLRTTID